MTGAPYPGSFAAWGIAFDPLVPLPVLWALGGLVLMAVGLAAWRRLAGWPLRAMAGLVLLGAIAQPSWQQEERAPLDDVVLVVVDRSDSQRLGDRAAVTDAAVEALTARLAARPRTRVRRITLGNGADNAGTLAMEALARALAEEPAGRVAGIFLVSDGIVHDIERTPPLPAPLHLLQTGHAADWDRRLQVSNAPAFAILGERVELTVRVDDMGAAPAADATDLAITVDGGAPQTFRVPIGQDLTLPVTLPHGGRNVITFSVPAAEGELTDRNNAAIVQINGVRDRLRVLLVSGRPHPGTRVWRNLLKSDASVDLVHFTILRPPEKQDNAPVGELSLIAFPTRELFLDRIDDFDLIIFDRYQLRGILPSLYLENVRRYIEDGGAVLVAAGPEFASAASLWRSPLGEALPARPTARVLTRAFRPAVSPLGARHPVTQGLASPDAPWGRWLRQIEVEAAGGQTVMSGLDARPLLVLDRVGKGRVALLASDHAWLWWRGYEGGGPQAELLRRLAHWMMKEPELEENALWAEASGRQMRIIRQTLDDKAGPVTVTTPSGATVTVPLRQVAPGRFEALMDGPELGLYRLRDGELSAVIGLGPAAPKEFEQTIASARPLAGVLAGSRGGAARLEAGMPQIRAVRPGRPAAGRGWLGITPRNAYQSLSVRQIPLLPAWMVLLLAGVLTLGAWLREGRR